MQELEHHVIRTAVALCGLAAADIDGRIRDDMRDEAVILMGLWTDRDSLALWCRRMDAELRALAESTDAAIVARTAVLRLQIILSPTTPRLSTAKKLDIKKPDVLGIGPKKVLQFVRENIQARAKDIIQKFSGSLSDRTVKRSLQTLVAAGQLIRTEEDGAIIYRVSA